MHLSSKPSGVLRFGPFELAPDTGELRKGGMKIRVPDQSLQVLTALVTHPGEIVTREDLARILWADGTQVDFENGLNAAVKKLRSALGDSGDAPYYIETIPRRGYRLIVPVIPMPESSTPHSPPAGRREFLYRSRVNKLVLAVLFVLAVGTPFMLWRSSAPAPPSNALRPTVWGRASGKPEANGYFAKYELFHGGGLNDLVRAREMLDHALRIDPRFGKARVEYGFSCLMMIDGGYSNDSSWVSKAEREILLGLMDDPTNARGHSALAAVFIYLGRGERALRETNIALQMNPADADARHWQAVHFWYSGDSSTARKLEEENRAKYARFFPTRMNLADLARQEGAWEDSIRELGDVLEYDPHNPYILQRLARTYIDSGRLQLARQTLDRLRPIDQGSFETHSLEALLLAFEGKRTEASTRMDANVLKYLDLNPLVTLTAAEVYAVIGNTPQALEWLERAVRHGDERTAWFARDPALESIRGHERFQQILRSLALRKAHQVEHP
jgi:DNA-binding winged helix-turn-helix (wHTH) protein/Flp pilus assembly protein TadD